MREEEKRRQGKGGREKERENLSLVFSVGVRRLVYSGTMQQRHGLISLTLQPVCVQPTR